MSSTSLYPELEPFRATHLAVDDLHELYVEECGRSDGLPVVFLHGGPGAGCEAYHRRFFDPGRYRAVLFDQRGCGRSRPHAELAGNTTQELVADIERVREHLGIDAWVVFGGSWGSTLGLAYAQAHPERVLGLILRGIFLCRDRDIDWFYREGGASRILPELWEEFLEPIPLEERGDLRRAYYQRLVGDDEVQRMQAAKAWSLWEGRAATLLGTQAVVDHFADPFVALSLARIECHYFINQAFLRPNQLLEDAARLRPIPGTVVHGRYDMVCPLEQAHALHQAWPQADYQVIPDAGHAATEPGIIDALVKAADGMADRLA